MSDETLATEPNLRICEATIITKTKSNGKDIKRMRMELADGR